MSLTPEQLQERRSSIGASEVAAFCGMSPWKSCANVIAEKKGYVEPENTANEYTDFGDWMEPTILERLGKELNVVVTPNKQMFRHPDLSFATATPDGLIEDAGPVEGAEAKATVSPRMRDLWENGEIPDVYRFQAAWQMFVCDLPRVTFGVLAPPRFIMVEQERNAEFEQRIVDMVTRRWERHVIGDAPPPADGHPDTTKFFVEVFRSDAETIIEADADADALISEYFALKEREKELSSEVELAKQRLIMRIEKNLGIEGSAGKVRWIETKGRAVTDWKKLAQDRGLTDEDIAPYTHITKGARFVRGFPSKENDE